METQLSTESTLLTHIELGEEGKLQKENLLKDGTDKRRAYIDFLNIFIVCGTFLGIVLQIYGTTDHSFIKHPSNDHSGIFEDFLITEDKYTIIPLDHWNFVLQLFGESYLLSLFYFISGFNAYLSLKKRSEQEFREERIHGVLVPILTLMILHLSSAFVSFAPLDHSCTLEYEANTNLYFTSYNETNRCQQYLRVFQNHTPFLSTLVQSTWEWALVYMNIHLLFIFLWAQMFAFWFCAVHPSINRQGDPSITYCGSQSCCCSRKPFSCVTKFFCCFNFFCKPAASPSELIDSLNWYLNGPARLILVPGLIIYLIDLLTEVWIKITVDVGSLESLFSNMAIFAFGFHIAATESGDIGRLAVKHRFTYLSTGLCLFLADAILLLTLNDLDHQNGVTNYFSLPVNYLFKSFGKWAFIIGILNIAKARFEEPREWLTLARSISLPFFVVCRCVLVVYLSGAFWVPYLRAFPFTLLICSFPCLVISYLLTKAGYFGYFFGVQSSKTLMMQKKKIFRLIPFFLLLLIVILINVLLFKFKDVYDPHFVRDD